MAILPSLPFVSFGLLIVSAPSQNAPIPLITILKVRSEETQLLHQTPALLHPTPSPVTAMNHPVAI